MNASHVHDILTAINKVRVLLQNMPYIPGLATVLLDDDLASAQRRLKHELSLLEVPIIPSKKRAPRKMRITKSYVEFTKNDNQGSEK